MNWCTSSFCNSISCVEVARIGDRFLVRSTQDPDRPPLVFDADEWRVFLLGVKAGEFDLPR